MIPRQLTRVPHIVILLVLMGIWCCVAVDNVRSNSVLLPFECNRNKSMRLTDFGDNDITETTVQNKVLNAKVVRSRPEMQKNYSFIESPYRPVLSKINEEGPGSAKNQTWRIICDPGRWIYVVLMNLQLGGEDYLQVKLTKINGTINHHFHGMFFRKRSILVSLVHENRDIFTSQSSFLLGYLCVANREMERINAATKFFNNKRVLQYMHCRPHTFEMLAKELVKTNSFLTYPANQPDIDNMLQLLSPGCITTLPQCTNTPIEEDYESSAEGIAE